MTPLSSAKCTTQSARVRSRRHSISAVSRQYSVGFSFAMAISDLKYSAAPI